MMINVSTIQNTISTTISRLTGLVVGAEHVHNDHDGWYYYIPADSLQINHPLLMCHYRGPLFVVIPTADWTSIEAGNVDAESYVEGAFWSYGYFWGGGSMLGGVNWMPLEDTPGITDKDLIYRYMTILSCRTHLHSCGYMPTWCNECSIQNCPFSKDPAKRNGADWANEVEEKDDRYLLYKAVSSVIAERFGLTANNCLIHNGDDSTIRIFPGYGKDNVKVEFPVSLMVDMLYRPGHYDIEGLAKSMTIEAGTTWYYNADGEFVKSEFITVPADADLEFIYTFWKKDPTFKRYMLEPVEYNEKAPTIAVENDAARDAGIWKRIWDTLTGLFK